MIAICIMGFLVIVLIFSAISEIDFCNRYQSMPNKKDKQNTNENIKRINFLKQLGK